MTRGKKLLNLSLRIQPLIESKPHSLFYSYLFKVRVTVIPTASYSLDVPFSLRSGAYLHLAIVKIINIGRTLDLLRRHYPFGDCQAEGRGKALSAPTRSRDLITVHMGRPTTFA